MCTTYRRCRLRRFRGCLASTAAMEALAAGVVEAGGAMLAISLPHSDLSVESLAGPHNLSECMHYDMGTRNNFNNHENLPT